VILLRSAREIDPLAVSFQRPHLPLSGGRGTRAIDFVIMAINVTCPSCGAKRSLSEAFRGLNVTCPKCGTRFDAVGSSSGSSDSLPYVFDEVATTQERESSSSSDVGDILPAEVGVTLTMAPPVVRASEAALPTLPPLSPPAPPTTSSSPSTGGAKDSAISTKREYKVLTRKNLWFTGDFNPDGLQEALNSFAQQGWTLKSTVVLGVPGPEGSRDELIVILER